jgi:hypothetical protein
MYVYMHVYEPGPEPELEPYSDKMSEPEPSSNFPVPQPWLKGQSHQILDYILGSGNLI